MTSNQSLQLTAGRRDDQISIDAGSDYGEKRTQFPVDAGRESGFNGSSGGHLWQLPLCTSSAA